MGITNIRNGECLHLSDRSLSDGNERPSAAFGDAFNELLALNPERAHEFMRNNKLLAPRQKLALSRSSGIHLTSHNLRQIGGTEGWSRVDDIADCLSGETSAPTDVLPTSRVEQRAIHDSKCTLKATTIR